MDRLLLVGLLALATPAFGQGTPGPSPFTPFDDGSAKEPPASRPAGRVPKDAPPADRGPASARSSAPNMGLNTRPIAGNPAGETAARVGNEEISSIQLRRAYEKYLREFVPPGQRVAKEDKVQIARQILEELITRTVVVQEARRAFKDQKRWDMFMKEIDKHWAEEKLPHLLKKYSAEDESDLKRKMEAKGESLEDLKNDYRQDTVCQDYLGAGVRTKIKPSLPEMLAHYRQHRDDYVAPSYVTWRELVVKVDAKTPRAEARKKAEAWHARLRRGDDFAWLARAESQGATAAKEGLWEKMRPGSYRVPAVNATLETLPVNQVSPIIEGPDSLHIVRVEGRRAEGPLSFEEVQDRVAETLAHQNHRREVEALIKKFRGRTVITNYYEEAARDDPSVKRTAAAGR